MHSCLFHLTCLKWNELDYNRYIEDDLDAPGFEMNSVQQGFLSSSTEHRMFDDYSIGINPDVGTSSIFGIFTMTILFVG